MKEKPTGKSSAKGAPTGGGFPHSATPKSGAALSATRRFGPPSRFWKDARGVIPEAKQTITIRLAAGLLLWLRQQKGYLTRINAEPPGIYGQEPAPSGGGRMA